VAHFYTGLTAGSGNSGSVERHDLRRWAAGVRVRGKFRRPVRLVRLFGPGLFTNNNNNFAALTYK